MHVHRERVHENNIQLSKICEATGRIGGDSEVQADYCSGLSDIVLRARCPDGATRDQSGRLEKALNPEKQRCELRPAIHGDSVRFAERVREGGSEAGISGSFGKIVLRSSGSFGKRDLREARSSSKARWY